MTTNADWPRLRALFERIADAAPPEGDRLLDELARSDPAQFAQLQRLLALDASDSDLAAEVSGWRERLVATDEALDVPTRIAAWKVVREIGAGGMGRVFLAERADGAFEQKVALKLIRGEFTTDAAIGRFIRERRILARLDHPGIASLVDGGVEEHGRPWFAMQYVEGTPLPEHCNGHRLGLASRLGLIIAICDAVAYAHRQLVVHCDLKPSNVLVDRQGNPRLLDFGIARLIDVRTDGSQATQTQLRALTPGYAAPEQLAGMPVGVATDVYALGVMLHELLTGRRPYADHDDTAAAVAVAQARGEAPLPSRIAGTGSPVPARRLRGDLDAIVAMALRHDVALRYPDAAALAEDLRRHLVGQPLTAQRTHALAQARKFVQRHRAGVAVAALAFFGLIATSTYALHQGSIARREAADAIAVRDFLVGIFRNADPRTGKGGIDTRMLIDRGAAGLDAALTSQPALASGFAEVLGNVYLQLAAYDEAEAMFDRALHLAGQRYGEDSAQSAPILRALARTLAERNKLDDAHKALDRARAIDARREGSASSDAIADMAVAADLAQRGGDLAAAQSLMDGAVGLGRDVEPANATHLATLLNQRADVEGTRGALDDAERDTREALALFRTQNGEQNLDVAESLVNLGVLRMRRGDADGAEPMFRQGLATYRRLLPAEHPLIADASTDLARALDRQGKPDQAEPIYMDVLAMQKHLFGDLHADVATTLNNLAVLHVGRGDYPKARAMMQQVVDTWTKLSGPGHPLALASRGNLGVIEREQGDYAAARETLEASLEEYRRQTDSAARQAYCLDQLGIVLRYEGKATEALDLHAQADALRASVKQLGPIERASGLVAWSLTETAAGDAPAALAHAQAAIALLDEAKSQGDARYADAQLARARALIASNDPKTAIDAVNAASALRGKLYGEDDWRTAEARLVGARIDAALGDRAAAATRAAAARTILLARRGPSNPLVLEADGVVAAATLRPR